MKKNFYYLTLFLFFIFVFTVFYLGLNKPNSYKPNEPNDKNLTKFYSTELFLNDELYSYEIIKNNKYTLVNIWASWCIPCRDEHPYLMELKKNEKLKIVGLNYKDKVKNANKFFVSSKIYPQTLEIMKTRSAPLGIELVIDELSEFDYSDDFFGILIQYPDSEGNIINPSSLIKKCNENWCKVVASNFKGWLKKESLWGLL